MEIRTLRLPLAQDGKYYIAPIGDIQWTGVNGITAVSRLKAHLDRCAQLNAWYLGMGDYPLPTRARILTRRGFKSHDEVLIGEDVLAYLDGETRWTPLLGIVRPGIQPMLSLKSKSFAAVSTPEHTWMVTDQHHTRELLVPARNLKTHHRIIVAAPCSAKAESDLSEEEARILGWLCTDGHVRTSPALCGYILQTKEPYRTDLRSILAEWITSEEQRYGAMSRFHLKTRRLRLLFEAAQLDPARYKDGLPSLVTSLSVAARRAMLLAMVQAEGWQERGKWRFSQRKGPVWAAFLILATLEGWRLGKPKTNKEGVMIASQIRPTPVGVADLKIAPAQEEECWCPQTLLGTWVAELDEQVFITGNTDFASPSNRSRLAAANIYETAKQTIDDAALALVADLKTRFLEHTVGRWVGLTEGHHYWTMEAGDTSDMRLCQLLKAPFLGTSAIVRLVLPAKSNDSSFCSVVLAAHHGTGYGQTAGAPLNKLEAWAKGMEGIDIYLMGHTAKAPNVPVNRLHVEWGLRGGARLKERQVRYVNTGGFSAAYTQGSMQGRVARGGYVERGMMTPAYLGAPIIEITVTRPMVNGKAELVKEIRTIA